MLFLGTEKYPDEASYSQYLSAHGGKAHLYPGHCNMPENLGHQAVLPGASERPFCGRVRLICSHGISVFASTGSSNAYTDTEDTVYYFDVDAKSALGALDRFSEFFKAPLFTAR